MSDHWKNYDKALDLIDLRDRQIASLEADLAQAQAYEVELVDKLGRCASERERLQSEVAALRAERDKVRRVEAWITKWERPGAGPTDPWTFAAQELRELLEALAPPKGGQE